MIRIVRPGFPVDPNLFIDLGPDCRGRISNSGGIFGGPIVAVRREQKSHPGAPGVAHPTTGTSSLVTEGPKRSDRGPRCGKMLAIIGEPCARKEGHRNDCRSRLAMDANAVARRSQGTRARR
jgi:hypothetical protein